MRYDFKCVICDRSVVLERTLAVHEKRKFKEKCKHCGGHMEQVFTSCNFIVKRVNLKAKDDSPYMDQGIGKVIHSTRQRADELKKMGARVKEEGSSHEMKVHHDDIRHKDFAVREGKKRPKKSGVYTEAIKPKDLARKLRNRKFVQKVAAATLPQR